MIPHFLILLVYLLPSIIIFIIIQLALKLTTGKKEYNWYGYGTFFGILSTVRIFIYFLHFIDPNIMFRNFIFTIGFGLFGPLIISSIFYKKYIAKKNETNELPTLITSVIIGWIVITYFILSPYF